MVTNRLLPLLIVIGLTTGCAAGMSSPRGAESSPIPSPLPTQTKALATALGGETPNMPAYRVTPFVPSPIERRPPPIDWYRSSSTPVAMAKADLSCRLQVDAVWIKVVKVVTREPNADDMLCLASGSLFEEPWASLGEVQWISLSVKDNVHHYIALGDLIVYCDR